MFASMDIHKITKDNVKERSEILLEMYKSTAAVSSDHNVLLQPLGNDFTYVYPQEYDHQYVNYMEIANYVNSHPEYKTEISFGTLSTYFEEIKKRKPKFPTLQGDFQPYASVPDEYWTGYYSSRAFWKVRESITDVKRSNILCLSSEFIALAGKS